VFAFEISGAVMRFGRKRKFFALDTANGGDGW
jgi:hypothetical protein